MLLNPFEKRTVSVAFLAFVWPLVDWQAQSPCRAACCSVQPRLWKPEDDSCFLDFFPSLRILGNTLRLSCCQIICYFGTFEICIKEHILVETIMQLIIW